MQSIMIAVLGVFAFEILSWAASKDAFIKEEASPCIILIKVFSSTSPTQTSSFLSFIDNGSLIMWSKPCLIIPKGYPLAISKIHQFLAK